MNLLLLFTHTDIQKAVNYAEKLLVDVDDFLPVHKRQLLFMLGNIYCLNKQYDRSKAYYRQCLKLAPKAKDEAKLLNNLAYASWQHSRDKVESDQQESVLKDESYVANYFKQAIELNEKHENPVVDQQDLEAFLSGKSQDEEFLQGRGADKQVGNLMEYLMMTKATKGDTEVSTL